MRSFAYPAIITLLLTSATPAFALGDINNNNTANGGAGGAGGQGGTGVGIGIGGNAHSYSNAESAAYAGAFSAAYQQQLQEQLQQQQQQQRQNQQQSNRSANTNANSNGPNSLSTGAVSPSQDAKYTDRSKTTAIAVAPPSFSYGVGGAVGQELGTEGYSIGFPVIGGGFGDTETVPTASASRIEAENLVATEAAYTTGPEDNGNGEAVWSHEREYGKAMYAVLCSYPRGKKMVNAYYGSECP